VAERVENPEEPGTPAYPGWKKDHKVCKARQGIAITLSNSMLRDENLLGVEVDLVKENMIFTR
jgi:hypothetical protein